MYYNTRIMSDKSDADIKMLKLLEKLVEGQEQLVKNVDEIRQTQNKFSTIMDTLATKGDVETTVTTAKEELQANMLDLGAKIRRNIHNHETRINNLETHTNTTDPPKN